MRYDYSCDSTGQVVEVQHGMNERFETWGALCERAGLPLGNTPPEAPVRRLISGGNLLLSKSNQIAPPAEASRKPAGHKPSCSCCH